MRDLLAIAKFLLKFNIMLKHITADLNLNTPSPCMGPNDYLLRLLIHHCCHVTATWLCWRDLARVKRAPWWSWVKGKWVCKHHYWTLVRVGFTVMVRVRIMVTDLYTVELLYISNSLILQWVSLCCINFMEWGWSSVTLFVAPLCGRLCGQGFWHKSYTNMADLRKCCGVDGFVRLFRLKKL